ncbi:hypothetical protein ABBQ38_008142 [Trebouxia sp. C0009 RCD-2024]
MAANCEQPIPQHPTEDWHPGMQVQCQQGDVSWLGGGVPACGVPMCRACRQAHAKQQKQTSGNQGVPARHHESDIVQLADSLKLNSITLIVPCSGLLHRGGVLSLMPRQSFATSKQLSATSCSKGRPAASRV